MSAQNSPSDDDAVAAEILDPPDTEADPEPVSHPWERLPKETTFAFHAFTRFRDLPAARRTLLAAYRQETGKKEARQPSGLWTDWCSRNHWKDRAAEYDAYLDKLAREKAEKAHLEELDGYRARQRQLAAAATGLSILMLKKVKERVETLEPEDIKVHLSPTFLRAATGAAQMATNAEAEALGIEDLLKQLDDEQRSDATEPD